ncbi:hypothetical protein MRX96_006531 [Rhipicephalus microplus]
MNENRCTPSDPCSYSDLDNPVSATSSKWNPSSTDATSCKRGRRTPLKVRMAAAPSLCVSEVSYDDAVRSSDLLQPTECSSSSLATETADTDYSYDQCSAYIAEVSEAEGTRSAYQHRVRTAKSADTREWSHSEHEAPAEAVVGSEVASSVLPVTTSGKRVNVQPAASAPSASALGRGAAVELTNVEWPPEHLDRTAEEGWKHGVLSNDVARVRVLAQAGITEGGATEECVDVHGLRILPANQELLLYPVAFLLLGVAIGVVTMVVVPLRTTAHTFLQPSTCTSPTCAQNAIYLSHLLSWDDMNPCDDFYTFVCRRWNSQASTATEEESLTFDDDYAATIEERMYAFLQNTSRPERLNVQALSTLLDKCVDTKRIEDDGWNPFLEVLFNISLEGFPLTPPVRQSMSVWKMAGKLLRRSGTAALLNVHVSTRPSAHNQDVVTVGLPEVISTAEGVDINELIRFYTNAAFAAVNALRKDFVPPSLHHGYCQICERA